MCVCLYAYPRYGQAPGQGTKLIRSWTLRARTDEKDGGPDSVGVYLQNDTAVTLPGLLSVPLTLGIWLRQSLSGN